VLGGGIHPEDLVLVGGRPGIGKTVATLQWAREAARSGATALYVCYEHGEQALLARLLCLELAELAQPEDVPELDKLRVLVHEVAMGTRDHRDLPDSCSLAASAYDAFTAYADRLFLVRATSDTGLTELSIATAALEGVAVLFVDYLQRVAAVDGTIGEQERVTRAAGGLKELALQHGIGVVACVAVDRDGLVARRIRLHHLRGSTALAHDADVVVMLNEKWSAVSKTHLAYDATRARTFRHWAVASVEKNRDGPAGIDVEFRKDFANFRFDPEGRFVAEQLVDDVLYEE
jgi:replicative DNA helicase